MRAVIWAIGVLFILEGVLLLIKPEIFKKLVKWVLRGRRVRIPAIVRIVLGVVFLISALSCKIPWIIIAFGILMASAGIVMLVIKVEKIKAMLDWWLGKSLTVYRVISIVAFLIGAIIIYAAGMPR